MSLTKTSYSMITGAVTNVLDFGAKGDGVTDDTAAIQAAITYTLTKGRIGSLNQIGGVVYFPLGRYRITSTLTNVTNGITIRGEPSGLDSVPIASAASGSMIFCDNTVAGFPMFTVNDGGPITIQDIGLNGTQTVTNSTCIQTGTGTTNIGLTQGHFSNVRFTGFSTVFSGAKMFDCSFYDCGFEYNTTSFLFIGGTYTAFNTLKFVSCIFFGGANAYFQVGTGAVLDNVTFASCIFQYDAAQTVNNNVFNVYDGTISNISFSACNFVGYNSSDTCLRSLSTTSSIKEIIFSACNFTTMYATRINLQAPIGLMYDIIFTGCIFQNSGIVAISELTDLSLVGNIFKGTTVITLTSCNDLVINSNNFVNCSVNPPIALSAIFTRVSISNNIFADAVASIPINASSTKTKMVGNVYIADVLMP